MSLMHEYNESTADNHIYESCMEYSEFVAIITIMNVQFYDCYWRS